ncbi:MAG: AMP-binding protein [Gammaproteobacteria bacterium]
MTAPRASAAAPPDHFGDDPAATGLDPGFCLPRRILHWARLDPERPFMIEVGGRGTTYAGFVDGMLRWCTLLREMGIVPGERVVSFLPPSIDAYQLWLACACIGAWEVPVNPELRGEFLHHVLADAGARWCFARPSEAGLAQAGGMPDLRTVVVDCRRPPAAPHAPARIDAYPGPGDVACVIYTSGTTGPAKGVMVHWGQLAATVGRIPRGWLSERDVAFAPWPMFHVTGRTPMFSMTDVGGRLVVREKFSLGEFWNDVRVHGVTTTTLAAIQNLIAAQAPSPADREHGLRIAFGGVAGAHNLAFQDRFGVRLVLSYGSTELGFAMVNRIHDAAAAQRTGWLRPGYAARIVDSQGRDCADGEAGELWVRPPAPELMMRGYLNRPEATAAAIVDGWYRTGDAMIRDPDGGFRFVDRMKDTIRRMGENISSTAMEAVVARDPEVGDCCVVGVPSAIAGQEVVLSVSPAAGAALDPAALYARLQPLLPRYMWPSWIAVVEDFPRTPSGKIRKVDVRAGLDLGRAWPAPRR